MTPNPDVKVEPLGPFDVECLRNNAR